MAATTFAALYIRVYMVFEQFLSLERSLDFYRYILMHIHVHVHVHVYLCPVCLYCDYYWLCCGFKSVDLFVLV